ncbi:MAG: hypothetical protein PHE49_04335, partial [bacterium]|nr:hypothetical protein [bacterium]
MNNNTNMISKNYLPVSKGKTKTALLKNTQFNSLNNLKGEKYQDNRASFNDELFKVLTVPGMSSLKESSVKISTTNNNISTKLNTNSRSSSASLNNAVTQLSSSAIKGRGSMIAAKAGSTTLGIDKSPSISIPEVLKANKPDSSSHHIYAKQASNDK